MDALARKVMHWAGQWRVLSCAFLAGLGFLYAGPAGSAQSNESLAARSETQSLAKPGTEAEEPPPPAKCSLSVTVSPKTFGAEGGQGMLTVKTTRPPDCLWQAESQQDWIRVVRGKGKGAGQAAFQVMANTEARKRQGTVVVASRKIVIRQEAAACQVQISPASLVLPGPGGDDAVTVEAQADCRWRAKSRVPWLKLVGSSGKGTAKIVLKAQANPDPVPRTGQVEVGNQVLEVSQSAGTCSLGLSPTSLSKPAAGGDGSFHVSPSHDSCLASPVSEAGWLGIGSTTTATGIDLPAGHQRSMDVQFSVQANPSASQRVGRIKVGSQYFTVTQAAGSCTITLSPAGQTITPAGGNGSFHVQPSHDSCLAGPVSEAAWLDILATGTLIAQGQPTGHQRSMDVQFSAQANTAPSQRVGKIKVGSQYFTVTQPAGNCSLSLSPTSQALPPAGGGGSFHIQPSHDSCLATPVSEAGWINIDATMTAIAMDQPVGQRNSMDVQFTAQANPSASPRTGRIKVGSLYFNVNQAATPCTFSLADNALTLLIFNGSTASTRVTANLPTCGWSVQGLPDWLTVNGQAARQGSGNVSFMAGPNVQTTQSRSATVQVAGQPLTLTQDGCRVQVYQTHVNAIANVSRNNPPKGYVNVQWSANHQSCPWQITVQSPWLSVDRTSGTGPGTVLVGYETNPRTVARTGQLTIAGQAVTVSQAGDVCRIPATLLTPTVSSALSDATLRVAANGPECRWGVRFGLASREWFFFVNTTDQYMAGQGPTDVKFRAARNLLASPRQATIELFDANSNQAGTYILTQEAGPCRFGVDLGTQTHDWELGSNVVNLVANGSQCAWQASSDSSWLQIVGLNQGRGSHQVTYLYQRNEGSAMRSGYLTIGGNRIHIYQRGKP